MSEITTTSEAKALERRKAIWAPRINWSDNFWTYVVLASGSWFLWEIAAALTIPILLPPPGDVARAFWRGLLDGSLLQHIGISYWRILVGWAAGCALAMPLGILAGRVNPVRRFLEPYIEFFRFVPPIAFITLFMIWFGLGELSKIALIIYTAFFTAFVNTMTGAMAVEKERVQAAQCLGAKPRQIFTRVIIPATVPHIVTGIRIALGLAFMTVVAAEFIASDAGVGYLIFNSRLFAQTENVFVGILTLGFMGFSANWALKKLVSRVAYRYDVKL